MIRKIYAIPVNPEPWRVPPLHPGRIGRKLIVKTGKDEQSAAFKEAVREALLEQGAEVLSPPYELHFHFYRQLAAYETARGGGHRKHWADATNMQKLTEDALQGVLIDNDRDVLHVSSRIIDQGPQVRPMIVVFVASGFDPDVDTIPVGFSTSEHAKAKSAARAAQTPRSTSNEWPTTEGIF